MDQCAVSAGVSYRLGSGHAYRPADEGEQDGLGVAVYQEAPEDEPAPDWIHYMNQAEVNCLAASTYIELALRAGNQVQWHHYATKQRIIPYALGRTAAAAISAAASLTE